MVMVIQEPWDSAAPDGFLGWSPQSESPFAPLQTAHKQKQHLGTSEKALPKATLPEK